MKKIVKKENMMKGAGVLLIVLVLLFSNLSVIASSAMDKSKQNIQTNKSSYVLSPLFIEGNETILDEDFTDATMPSGWPSGWTPIINNSDDTWYVDDTDSHSEPYCGTCYHDNGLQDEWLITPSLNFEDYIGIHMRFWWYTSYYEAVEKDYHDLNVIISTDGGANWTLIWNEDKLSKFYSWVWYDTNFGEPIDLSAYIDETDVRIGFQYYSAEGVDGREFSIDDIVVYGNSASFVCNAGGPYYYHWDYQPIDFRHASVIGGEPPYTWQWDFGDNDTATTPPLLTRHYYDDTGDYNVSITVRDSAQLIAFGNATVHVYTGDPPEIQMDVNKNGIGIDVEFKNVGNENISYIEWKIVVRWGPLKIFEQEIKKGTIKVLTPKIPEYINSGYFLGFGRIDILISATPEGAPAPPEQRFRAFKIGPFIFNAHKG